MFKSVKKSEVPKFAKIFTSTWQKQKADGTLRARVIARGYKQRLTLPVIKEASIFLILILIYMARMYIKLIDIKRAF